MELNNQIINVPIFNCNIHLFTGDKDNIKKALQAEFGEEGTELFNEIKTNDSVNGSSIMLSNGYKIIWLPKYQNTYSDNSILVHEIFHTAINIMLSREIQLNNDTEEVCAYLIEYLYSEILKVIRSNETD